VLREDATQAMAELAERTGIRSRRCSIRPTLSRRPTRWRSGRWPQRLEQRQPHRAPGRRHHRDRRAFRRLFDDVQVRYFSEQAKIVHHSAAPGQIGIVFPVALGVTGSTASFIAGLAGRAAQAGLNKSWADVAKARADCETELQATVRPDAEPIQPQFVAHMNTQVLPRNGMLASMPATAPSMCATTSRATSRAPSCASTTGLRSAVRCRSRSARSWRADRPVLCASGDMGAMCNIGELETAVRRTFRWCTSCSTIRVSAMERAFQQEHYGGRLYAVITRTPTSGRSRASSGSWRAGCAQTGDLEGALQRAFASGKPTVVDVMIDQHTLAAGGVQA